MSMVQQWTGRETRMLRHAMRLTVRDFAAHLGVSERNVSKWEAQGASMVPRPETQQILDTAHARLSDEARARFAVALGVASTPPTALGEFGVESHKFIPVFVGIDTASALVSGRGFGRYPLEWLSCLAAEVDHPTGQCTLYVFANGVLVAHLREVRRPASVTDLATWRYRSYKTDLPWLSKLLMNEFGISMPAPEYVLSAYWLTESPWTGQDLDTAVRMLCTPSVLVDRTAPGGPQPLGDIVEASLFADGFDHPDVQSFGVPGVSVAYAGWSGVAYYPLSAERALSQAELVDCELVVQMLWCYSRNIQRSIEDGSDPLVPAEFGWRFLRAAHSRLTTARAQETAAHCLMRTAILDTSGLAQRLLSAQQALRESDTSFERTVRWTSAAQL
jgi:transcriptional regulator with XRE-family HTH domain